MDQKHFDAIKERVAKATQGPWEYDEEERGIWNKGGFNYLGSVTLSHIDAEFLANTREDVPALVAEVERLQKRLAQTEKCYEIMEKALFKASDKMSGFKKALEFYANENSHFRVDMYAESTVMQDKGEIARQVLGGGSQ